MADIYPESRVEEILVAMINGEEYTKFPESRIEALLIELLGKIIEVEGRGAYEFKGSVDFDELPETLTEDMAGWTYNMAEAFTTDERFVDGSGKSYPQGTNVSVANVGTDDDPVMMFDVPSAFVDVTAIYNTIHTVVANLASTFSDQIAYHTGDLVVKDDVLYKFTSDHAAGEWNPSHASTATLASLLIEVYNTITQVSNTIPTQLSQLTDDDTHRLVTDTEKTAWNGKQSALTFDSTPTEDSLNPVTSDGIFDALATKQNTLPVSVSSDDVTFQGDVTDGDGNSLSEIGSLCKSASGNPIVVNAQPVDAKELSVKLEPIQDLHGYDHPWAGGAGKNKLYIADGTDTVYNATVVKNNDAVSVSRESADVANRSYVLCNFKLPVGTYKINGGGTTTSGVYCTLRNGTTDEWIVDITNDDYTLVVEDADFTYRLTLIIFSAYTGNITIYPMLRLSTETDATFAPYTNICPISGRTETSAKAEGFNQWNYGIATGYGSNSFENAHKVHGNPITIHVKRSSGTGQINYKVYNADGTTAYNDAALITSGNTEVNLTIPNNIDGLYLVLYGINGATSEDVTELQVAAESSYSSYEPYNSSSATISFGQTVYGARINFKTGEGIVDKKSGDTTITKIYQRSGNANCDFAVFQLPDGILYHGNMSEMQCNKGHYSDAVNFDSATLGCILAYDSGRREYVIAMPKGYTLEQAQSYYGTIQICDVLVTPITLTLTPSMLKLLEGYNYITADGEMQLVYIPENALGELYSMVSDETDDKIDALDAEDVDALPDSIIIASEFSESITYVKNKYVIYNGAIYRCKEYHAAGAWNASNFDPVTFGDELFDAASFNKFYGNANYDGTTEYKVDHSYVHQGTSNIPDYPSDGKAGTTNRFGILKTMRIDTGYIFQTLIVSYEGEPVDETPTIKSKFYYRSAIRINGTYVWGNWYETTGTEMI